MRGMAILLAGSAMLLIGTRDVGAACSNPGAVATTRADADAACELEGRGCTSAPNHGQYVACVAQKTNAAVIAGTLPKECKGAVKKCAAKSTCGKPGFVTCCRHKPKSDGTTATKCTIKRDAAHCLPPKGGSACPGTHASCCDDCLTDSCSPSGAFVD
jgi:hypothetical protein